MDLKAQLDMISELIASTEDKDTIGKLGSLADSLKEQDKTFKAQEDTYLDTIAKWREAYKESILKGGFQTPEASSKADVVEDKIPTFEELLAKYSQH